MRRTIRMLLLVLIAVTMATPAVFAQDAAGPLKVTVDEHNVIHVNGKRFLPIGVWAQPESSFGMWKDLGINLFITSSHPRKGGTVGEYVKAAEEHKVLMSLGYNWVKEAGQLEELNRHPLLFTLHHPDEPDKPATASDAKIVPVNELRINAQRQLFMMIDGNQRSSAVIDPLKDAAFTIQLPEQVTASKLALVHTAGENNDSIRRVEFLADGRSILQAAVTNERRQEFDLPQAATFRELTVRVLEIAEGKNHYGIINEIEAINAEGKNVLESPTRVVPRIAPEKIIADYRAIKKLDPNRLVSLTIMARYMEEVKFQAITKEEYKAFMPGTDLIMYDLYPVSIWGKNLHWNAEGLKQLRTLAGPNKPMGIWLQSSDAMNKNDPGLTPTQIKANTWMSLINGATFIGYFPQSFASGFKFFDINDERKAALKAVNQQVTELAEIILSKPRTDLFKLTVPQGARVDCMQRREGNKVMLAMVNVIEEGEGKPIRVTIEPDQFKPAGAALRHDDNQQIAATDGRWTIELAPWETAVLMFDVQP